MKKLVFYSNQFEPDADEVDSRLMELIGKPHPSIGFIPSCADPDRSYFRSCQIYYGRYGATMPVYFELDVCYQPDLLESLLACDAIHLSGGNTCNFLHWLRIRQMIPHLLNFVDRGGVLIGVSAGSILMTPDISTTDFFGDKSDFGIESSAALNLVDFSFVPHIGKIPLTVLQDYSRQHQVTLYGCHDEDGIIIDDDEIDFIGNVIKIVNGEIE